MLSNFGGMMLVKVELYPWVCVVQASITLHAWPRRRTLRTAALGEPAERHLWHSHWPPGPGLRVASSGQPPSKGEVLFWDAQASSWAPAKNS